MIAAPDQLRVALLPEGSKPLCRKLDSPQPIRRPSTVGGSRSEAWSSVLISGIIHLLLLGSLGITTAFEPVERVTLSGSRFVISAEFSESTPTVISSAVLSEVVPEEAHDEAPHESLPTLAAPTLPEVESELPPDTLSPQQKLERFPPSEIFETETAAQQENFLAVDDTAPEIDVKAAIEKTEAAIEKNVPVKEDKPVEERQLPVPSVPSFSASVSVKSASTSVGLDDLTPAKLLHNPPPDYPTEAIAKGWSGRALLRLSISTEGKVIKIILVESSGYALLDKAAKQAVQHWAFEPARRAGSSIDSTALLPVRFRM